MRRLLQTILLFGLTGCYSECENVEPIDPIDRLPPATQTGEYTFGCLVNGEAFTFTNTYYMHAMYQRGVFQMSASYMHDDIDESIGIVIYDNAFQKRTYHFNDSIYRAGYSIFHPADTTCRYNEAIAFDGFLIIDNFDPVSFIVSGRFEFTTAQDRCDTIYVTDGRFDFHYSP